MQIMASEDYRVLGIGVITFSGNNYSETQQEFSFKFMGIVSKT